MFFLFLQTLFLQIVSQHKCPGILTNPHKISHLFGRCVAFNRPSKDPKLLSKFESSHFLVNGWF